MIELGWGWRFTRNGLERKEVVDEKCTSYVELRIIRPVKYDGMAN